MLDNTDDMLQIYQYIPDFHTYFSLGFCLAAYFSSGEWYDVGLSLTYDNHFLADVSVLQIVYSLW